MSSVKVAIRMRPFNKRERHLRDSGGIVTFSDDGQTIVLKDPSGTKEDHQYTFDHAFDSSEPGGQQFVDQSDVFENVGNSLVESTFQGYNGCIFAYGQTGSGKSYTMMGLNSPKQEKGVIPRLCEAIFSTAQAKSETEGTKCEIQCTYMEVYNEKVYDLLDTDGGRHKPLAVRESPSRGPFVVGITEMAVDSYESVAHLVEQGNQLRHISSTAMNATSSRSHSIFELFVKQINDVKGKKIARTSRLNLVDLAGSERQKKTQASGEALKEGAAINQSLSTLGLVISGVVKAQQAPKKHAHIPYRSSVLTWLLRESFGGNAKTVMVATISPAADNFDETLSTLRYADRAKQIKNQAMINESPADKIVRELREHVAALEAQLAEAVKSGATHAEVVKIHEDKKIHEVLLQSETTDRDVKLAETQACMDATFKELEANREKLQALMREEKEEKEELKCQKEELQALRDHGLKDREIISSLKAKIEQLEEQHQKQLEEHMQYAAGVQPRIDTLEQTVKELHSELSKFRSENEDLKCKLSESNVNLRKEAADMARLKETEAQHIQEATKAELAKELQLQTQLKHVEDEEQTLSQTVEFLRSQLEAAQADAAAARARVAPLEAHIAKLKVELIDSFDKAQWNPERSRSPPGSVVEASHLVRPSALPPAIKKSAAAQDAFKVLANSKEAELQRRVAELENEVAAAREHERIALAKASDL